VGKSEASGGWEELDLDGMAVLEWLLESQVWGGGAWEPLRGHIPKIVYELLRNSFLCLQEF